MEENMDVKKKNEPSIPANYVSILQLQERWLKEKERKQKEKEEEEEGRRRKQQLEEQRRQEKVLEKLDAEKQVKKVGDGVRSRKSDGKGFGRRHAGRPRRGKERVGGGEAISGDADGPEAAAIVSDTAEAAAAAAAVAEGDERSPENKRKKEKRVKKKRYQAPIQGDVSADSLTKDIGVKQGIRRLPRAKGERGNPPRENAPTDPKTAIETRFEILTINGGEERGDPSNLKPSARLNRGRDNQRHYRRPIYRRDSMMAAMVWVKKGEILENGGGSSQ